MTRLKMTLLVRVFVLLLPASMATCADTTEPSNQRPRNPLVRVVTISQEGLSDAPGKPLLEATMARLNRAASFNPDIACLPETFTRGEPEAVPGPTTDRLSAWARKHSCYVVCPITVLDNGRAFNSAVLIDRSGTVGGRYDKIRPTEGELESAVQPGAIDPPVFHTDFGLIGVQICFDVNWHAQWRRLKEKGARIIFFPSPWYNKHGIERGPCKHILAAQIVLEESKTDVR